MAMTDLQARHDTLVAALWPRAGRLGEMSGLLRNLLLAVAGSLLLWAAAKVQVPFYPVPITMTTFAVLAIGMAYGWRLGAATVLLYLAEGAMGLPVFAGTPEKGIGLAYMAGPTGGYLLGYVLAAAACGWLAERGWDRTGRGKHSRASTTQIFLPCPQVVIPAKRAAASASRDPGRVLERLPWTLGSEAEGDDKSGWRLPSRHVHGRPGPGAAPLLLLRHGPDRGGDRRPFVGVVTTWNEAAPCNIALSRQAQAVKQGGARAGGTPREFTTITVTDGIAMGHQGMKSSLVSREVIADSVELTMRGHCYDALVGLAGCDKSLPGMMMAMVRLNVPSVFMYGGSILPGRFKGRDVTVSGRVRGGRQHAAGKHERRGPA
jgi:biotin transporter BioY